MRKRARGRKRERESVCVCGERESGTYKAAENIEYPSEIFWSCGSR